MPVTVDPEAKREMVAASRGRLCSIRERWGKDRKTSSLRARILHWLERYSGGYPRTQFRSSLWVQSYADL